MGRKVGGGVALDSELTTTPGVNSALEADFFLVADAFGEGALEAETFGKGAFATSGDFSITIVG